MEQQYIVWLSEDTRIASFHPVTGYRKQSFFTHDFFLHYIEDLQSRGFRFQ